MSKVIISHPFPPPTSLENTCTGPSPLVQLHSFDQTTFPWCLTYYYIIINYLQVHLSVEPSIKTALLVLNKMQRMLISTVVSLFQLLIIHPAINATLERSFSALHQIKSYLKSSQAKQLNDTTYLLENDRQTRYEVYCQ